LFEKFSKSYDPLDGVQVGYCTMPRLPYSLPLAGYTIEDVQSAGQLSLTFDDVNRSCLILEGPFRIGSEETSTDDGDVFAPPTRHGYAKSFCRSSASRSRRLNTIKAAA
jgi:hypothetical protein